jgi:hypothetical protein
MKRENIQAGVVLVTEIKRLETQHATLRENKRLTLQGDCLGTVAVHTDSLEIFRVIALNDVANRIKTLMAELEAL